MRKALGAALACLTLALALAVAAGAELLTGDRTRDGSAPPASPTVSASAAPTARIRDGAEALAYFTAVAFSTEYGGSDTDDGRIRKWEDSIRIAVCGTPTREDLETLDGHIADLNHVPGMPGIRRVVSDGNAEIHFVPLAGMASAVPGYVEGNWGFFQVWWDHSMRIKRACVAIATDVTTQAQRNHLILEEVTQMLGVMQDDAGHEDSIFYGPWTEIQALSALDWQVLCLLYRSDILPGMTREEATARLTGEGANP